MNIISQNTWTHYLYRIDFVDGDYYYGKKKRSRDDHDPTLDKYWGSPGKTHRDKWKTTMFSKTIVAYLWVKDEREAGEIEDNLIRKNGWNTKSCLNSRLGMNISTAACVEAGKKVGRMTAELGLGFHTPEHRSAAGKIGGKKAMGIINEKLTSEDRSKNAKKACSTRRTNNPDEYFENQRNAGLKGGSKIFYMCLETGYISNSTGLSVYQKKRGIDTKKRIRMSGEEMAMILLWGNPLWWSSEKVRTRKWYVNEDGERIMAKDHPGQGWQLGMVWKDS